MEKTGFKEIAYRIFTLIELTAVLTMAAVFAVATIADRL